MLFGRAVWCVVLTGVPRILLRAGVLAVIAGARQIHRGDHWRPLVAASVAKLERAIWRRWEILLSRLGGIRKR